MNWNGLELPDKNIYFKDDDVLIYCDDCRDILPLIPDKSIDLVLTDPPYKEDLIDIFGDIASGSVRLLKEGHFLYAYCGTMFLPQIIPMMAKYLDWFWLHNIRHNGGYPSIWSKHIQQNSKPILCFTNGKPIIDKSLRWTFSDFTRDRPDKKYHGSWGQGIGFPLDVIQLRTAVGGVVLDSCVGGGSIPMAAKILNRKCIGIEIEERYCEISAKRCSQSVMKLEV